MPPKKSYDLRLRERRSVLTKQQTARRTAIRRQKKLAEASALGAIVIDRVDVAVRWTDLQRERGISTANDVAVFLLDRYNNNNNNFYSRGFRVGSEHIYKPDGHNSVKHNTKHNIIITFLQHNAYRALYYS